MIEYDKKERKKFLKCRDRINHEIYKNIKYDDKKQDLIIKILPKQVKIHIQMMNSGFLDVYGYSLYMDSEKELKIHEMDQNILINRVKTVVEKLNEINDKKLFEVIK